MTPNERRLTMICVGRLFSLGVVDSMQGRGCMNNARKKEG